MIILSNNVWNCDDCCDWWKEHNEDSSAKVRVLGLIKAYKEIFPDIMGFQEMSRMMEKLLMEKLKSLDFEKEEKPIYKLISGGYTPIIYRGDKFNVIEEGHFLYPEHIKGFDGLFNDSSSKGFTYGVFEEIQTGKRIIVITTHLWWKDSYSNIPSKCQIGSDEARVYQIKMVSNCADDLLKKYNCPLILMGDMNCTLNSDAIKYVLNNGWIETHNLSIGEKSDVKGLHYCYPDGYRHDPEGEYKDAIDHILIKNKGQTIINKFCRYTETFFDKISDHFPVYIDIDL